MNGAPVKILVLDRSEDLAEQTRAALADIAAPEVVSCTRIGSVNHVLEHEGPFDLILAGPSLATRAGLRRLAAIHREMPGAAVVIGFTSRPDASLREIVQVGAIDLVELPTEDMVLRAAIRRALDWAERTPRVAPALAPVGAAAPAAASRSARIFTVCSATGGCGKTFYSTNMALFLAQHSGGRVALVDIDLQFGEITTALRLQPSYTIADALKGQGDPDAPDLGEHLEDFMVKFDDKFWVLPAPKDPAQADSITPVDTTRILEALRTRFDYIVVDTPTALAETVLAAFDLSEHLFVMATLDLPSVRNLGMFLQTLQKLRISSDNIDLVMNKVEKDVGIEVGQITKLFPQGFHATLPYTKEVSKSVNLGKPVIASFPESEMSRLIEASLVDWLPDDARERFAGARSAPVGDSWFARTFRRRSAIAGGAS